LTWHAFKERSGKVLVASSMELKAKYMFWMGGEERSDSVGVFIAEKWVECVVNVERRSKRVLILKMVLDNGLLNVVTVYASHSGKMEEEKESFWNEVFHLVSSIPQNKMVVLVDDMNGLSVDRETRIR